MSAAAKNLSSKIKILVVDDDKDFLELVEAAFEDTYEVTAVDNSKTCLEHLEKYEFNLVLLDVNIDDMNGFDICAQVKNKQSQADVIFLSGLSKQEDIVKGYQAGALDYLIKPIRLKELREKAVLILNLQERIHAFEVSSKDAQQVAFSAMTDSSQLGRILEFMDNNINCDNISDVAEAILETCVSLNLQATAYIETPKEKVTKATGGLAQPIETLLIEQVRHQNRIIDFNQRTLYSDKHVSVLVKNMPLDNPIEYGRLKDSLMTLACGANSRVRAILNEQMLNASRASVGRALEDIEDQISGQTSLATNLMRDFMVDMESTILVLGLSEEQEEYVMSLVDSHLKNVVELVTSATETQSLLQSSLKEIQ